MAKPKLALIPASQGPLVYSVLPSDGSGDFSFSRGSEATRINSQGLIENVLSGQSRLEYPMIDGVVNGCPSLLLEPSRTNLLQYSEDFSQSAWNKDGATILGNNVISPDGTLNADKITFVSGNERLYYIVSTTSAVFSVYLKGVNGQKVRIRNANGLIKTNVSLTEKWERYEVFIDESNSNIQIENIDSEYVYAWGAQLEQGSYATSYIPTNGTTVARSAETATGSGDASTFNDSEGVLMMEISTLVNNGDSRRISISHSVVNNDNRIALEFDESTSTIKAFMRSGGSTVGGLTVNNINQTNNNKIALLYKANAFEIYINGFLLGTDDTIASLPIGLSRLQFEDANGGSRPFYGSVKQIQYFDSALNDSDLETLTSWVSFQDMANSQLYSIK